MKKANDAVADYVFAKEFDIRMNDLVKLNLSEQSNMISKVTLSTGVNKNG